jgi:hypothetical protein
VTLDDGKANSVSKSFSAALEAGLDFALAEVRAVVIAARPAHISACCHVPVLAVSAFTNTKVRFFAPGGAYS